MVTLLLLAVCVVLCCYIIWKSYWADTGVDTDALPPGTMGWPLIGETIEFAKKKVQFFKERQEHYGRIYKTSLFGKRIIRVCGAENIRKVTLGENKIVRSSYPTSVTKLLGEDSIVVLQGEAHHTRKQQLQKYLCPEYLKNHVPILAHTISERIQHWCAQPAVDIHKECRKLFTELAIKFLVKLDIDDDDVDGLREALTTYSENIFCIPFNLPGFGFRKAQKAKATLRKLITDVLNKPSMNNNDSDQLPSLLEGLRANKGDLVDMTEENQFLDATIELLFAGTDTVTSAGFSLVHNLIKHPDVLDRLGDEAKAQGLDNPNKSICAHDIKEMPYLQAVVKETLRVAPPIGGAYRTAIESFDLEGYTVPKGWSVVFSIRETHQRNPSVPDPYTFNPAQWLEPNFSQDKHAYLPFGAGPRICPGQAYGKLILQLFAVELARTCTARITQDSDIQEWPTPRPMDKMLVKFQQI